MEQKFKFGWLRDLPDQRDHIYQLPEPSLVIPPPAVVDLRSPALPVYDQGSSNSCTANAVASLVEFDLILQKANCPYTPSRLFIYYNTRLASGNVYSDSGASLRATIKSLNTYGFCNENLWPYNPDLYQHQPLKAAYTAALKRLVYQYSSVMQTEAAIKAVLSSGLPLVFGFTVYQSFMSNAVAMTGMVPMPSANDYPVGGHAMTIMGFNDGTRMFTARNSWGPGFGDGGYVYMPYDYVLSAKLSSDFWVVRSVNAL